MNVCQTGASVRAAACVRAIDSDRSCRVTNDRMSYMTTHRPDCAGKSLLELLWDQLMGCYGELAEVDWDNAVNDDFLLRGEATGLATAISIITNPYAPDVDRVRAEAAERYTNQ